MNKFITKLDDLCGLILIRIKNTYLYTIPVSLCLDSMYDYLDKLGELDNTLCFAETFWGTCVLFIIGCILYTFGNEFYRYIKNKYKSYIVK